MWAIVIGGGIAAFCIWAFLDGAVKRRHDQKIKDDIRRAEEAEEFVRDNPQNFPPQTQADPIVSTKPVEVDWNSGVRHHPPYVPNAPMSPPRPHYTMEGPITSPRDGKQRYMIYEHSFQGGKQLLKTFMHQDRAQAYLNLLQGN